ncbi:hypothetical protein [Vibrio sinaloensis]|uniref:hypothetical protein n=1 Tax=Photobacterium sp. (strain ATCC 43367) TaxID=379097 RepID=UPI0035EA7BBB
MKFTLQENQPYPVTISGTWLWLRYASEPILMKTESGEHVTIPQGAVIKNNELLGRVLLHSSASQTIDIEFGKGDFQPPSDGQRVAVDKMPPVEIAPDQTISFAPDQVVTLAEGSKVQASLAVANAITTKNLGMPATIPENPTRKKITIRTPNWNKGAIQLNGNYPLYKGETIEIESTAAIELTGAETDRVLILECHDEQKPTD